MKKILFVFLTLFFVLTYNIRVFAATAPNNKEYTNYFEVSNNIPWTYNIWINSERIAMSKQHATNVQGMYYIYGLRNDSIVRLVYYYHQVLESDGSYNYGYCNVVGSGVTNHDMYGYPNANCPVTEYKKHHLGELNNLHIHH